MEKKEQDRLFAEALKKELDKIFKQHIEDLKNMPIHCSKREIK